MSITELGLLKKSGRAALGTNFLSLLSGCFTAPTRRRGPRRPKAPPDAFRLFHARRPVKPAFAALQMLWQTDLRYETRKRFRLSHYASPLHSAIPINPAKFPKIPPILCLNQLPKTSLAFPLRTQGLLLFNQKSGNQTLLMG